MAGLKILDASQFAFVEKLLHEQELATVDDRFHHHVRQARSLDQVADLSTFLDRSGHRNRTRYVLAGLQGLDRLRRMARDRRIDMHRIDIGIRQQFVIGRIAFLYTVFVADLVQRFFVSLTDRGDIRVRVLQIDGNELGAETQSN